jgi:AsmA family protein
MISEVVEEPGRGSRWRMTPLRIVAALALLLVLLILGVALLPSSFWRSAIVRIISHATHREVSIDGAVQVHLLSLNPDISVEGFRLGNAPWAAAKDMLSVSRFEATLNLASLLSFHPVFPRVAMDTPVINLERDASGRANWEFQSAGGKAAKKNHNSAPLHIPVIQQLSLTNGTLRASDQIRKLKFAGQISVQEKRESPDDHALSLRGKGELNNKPFELRLNGEPLIGVQPSKPYGFDVSVTAADIKFNAHTNFPHPFDLGTVHSTFHLSGSDLADVYYLTGLALPDTPAYDISGTAVRAQNRFQIDDLQGRLGSSDIAGKVSIDVGRERPKLTANLRSNLLSLADLAVPLGTEARPEGKSQTLSQPTTIPSTAARPTLLLPDADLQINRVRGMDADVTFDAASVTTAKLPMKKVHFHLVLDDAKITLEPLAFTLPQGQLSGNVNIDARGATPQTSLDMKLENVDLAQFKPKSGNAPLRGQLLGRIQLHGTGTSVHKTASNADGDITLVVPRGEMRAAFAELTGIDLSRGLGLILTKNQQETAVRCGVANFRAGDGDLKATTLLIDTAHVLVTGSGQIDLKSEAMDLSLQGQPKQARLLRLRTPITVRGTLLQPKVGVQAGKLAGQAGGALALGALLTPVAALLAFVDGGLAKDANCAGLISQVEQGKNIPQE